MFLFLLSVFSTQSSIGPLKIIIKKGSFVAWDEKLSLGETTSFNLTENETLSLSLATDFAEAPSYTSCVLELGSHAVTSTFKYQKSKSLVADFTPIKLKKLYKHSGKYQLSLLVSDQSSEKPFTWKIGTVDFIANNEVVDNFTDVEWDFQPPPATPKLLITETFNLLMLLPFAILIILLLINGINCGYFPRNFIDAIFSLAFVVCLGAFFGYFYIFWKDIYFEDMIKSLVPISLVLGFLLRRALIGRKKMIVRSSQREDAKPKSE